MMGVRKALDWVFSKNEMKILDDILPEHKRTERLDEHDDENDKVEEKESENAAAAGSGDPEAGGPKGGGGGKYSDIGTTANGNVIRMPTYDKPDINISEEINKCGIVKSLEANSNSNSANSLKSQQEDAAKTAQKNRRKKSRQMSIVDEDADENEDTGITIKLLKQNKIGEQESSGSGAGATVEEGTGEEKAKLVSNNSTESDL